MIVAIITIILTIVITLMVTSKVIPEKYYPYCVAVISLGLVYQTTMLGIYTVGSDIQRESYLSRVAMNGWSPGAAGLGQSNTSIVIGVIAPLLSTLLHIDMVWIYKAVLPLFLVATPVILFHAFRLQIGDLKAYFATLFFMIVPVFNLEIAQIGKSMVAEFFFALMILSMVSRSKWKAVGIIGSLLMTIFCHYTIGILALCYLASVFVARLVTYPIKWDLLKNKTASIKVIGIALLIGSLSFFAYYSYVLDGELVRTVTGIPKAVVEETQRTSPSTGTKVSSESVTTAKSELKYMEKQEYLVKAGIGLDFAGVSAVGKVFRVLQYLTELLIVIGACYLFFNYKKYNFSLEFMVCIGASFALLLMCIFVPKFSLIINMTRFYHMSLFFLAPMLVLLVKHE
jgi:uncharacterized membrane protein